MNNMLMSNIIYLRTHMHTRDRVTSCTNYTRALVGGPIKPKRRDDTSHTHTHTQRALC